MVDGDEQGSASLFSQLVLVGYFCVFGELTRVRDCFLLAGVAATTSLVTSADFETCDMVRAIVTGAARDRGASSQAGAKEHCLGFARAKTVIAKPIKTYGCAACCPSFSPRRAWVGP